LLSLMYGRSAEPMSINSSPLGSIRQDPVLKTVIWGFLAGLLGGVTMPFHDGVTAPSAGLAHANRIDL